MGEPATPYCSLQNSNRSPSVLSARGLHQTRAGLTLPRAQGYVRFAPPSVSSFASRPPSLTSLDLEWDSGDCFRGVADEECPGGVNAHDQHVEDIFGLDGGLRVNF